VYDVVVKKFTFTVSSRDVNLFLESLVSKTVHRSAGREFHDAGPEKEKACSPNYSWLIHAHIQHEKLHIYYSWHMYITRTVHNYTML